MNLGLKDRVSIYEFNNKTLQWIINADYRLVELEYKANRIKVNQEVKDYIKERKRKRIISKDEYYVAPSVMSECECKLRSRLITQM